MSKWDMVRLGDVCDIERGGSPRPIENYITEDENGINWIKIGDAPSDSMYISQTKQKIKREGIKKSRYVRPGDFLLSNSMSFGRPYIMGIDGCIHDGWLVLRDKCNCFHKEFLYYALSSRSTVNKFKGLAVGGVVNNLNTTVVKQVIVPLPPLETQRKIAQVLDTVSELLALRKQQLAELDSLIKSTFYDMFGDPVTNEKGWKLCTVKDVCSEIFGGGTPSKKNMEFYTGSIPWVTPKDMKTDTIIDSLDHITQEAIDNCATKLISPKSILMVIRSGILKKTLPVAINIPRVTVNQDMKAFLPNEKIVAEYLLYVFKLMERSILKNIRGVTADNLEFGLIRDLNIPVPPKTMQKKFANTLGKLNESRMLVKQSVDETQNLFDSLMPRYFN